MAEVIRNKIFKMKQTCNWQHLRTIGFRKFIKESDKEPNRYYYVFPVLKYKEYTNLECKICVEDQDVQIDLYDNHGNFYPPFYYDEFGNYDNVLKLFINSKIMSEFKKLGIVEVV